MNQHGYSRIHQAQLHKLAVPGITAMTLVSNHHFPRHSHDQFGIGVITSGAQRSWSGVGRVEAGAGDLIMTNPGEMHDGMPLDGSPRRWKMLYFDPAVVSRQLAEEMKGSVGTLRPVARDALLARRLMRLFASLTAPRPDDLESEESLLRSLMHVFRHHGMEKPASGGPTPRIARALERLDSAPASLVSLAELAALTGVSRFQLLRGFAREMGITPHAYLMQRRVLLARQLLAAGGSLAQAAIQAGFADQSHMTRAFLRQLGITPGRYRAALA